MEILLYIFAGLIGLGGLFLLIEYPYHFIGVFFFILHYEFNIELPGPLDLRGWLTIVLFFRLIVFDKENLEVILNLLTKDNLFILIILFELLFVFTTYVNTNSYLAPIRMFIFQMIYLILALVAVYRGHAMKSVFAAFVFVGLFSSIDLLYSYGLGASKLHVTRVLDILFKSEYSTELNHNKFGNAAALSFSFVFIMLLVKQYNKKILIFLLFVFSVGVLLSTSRAALLTVIISTGVGTLLIPREYIDIKKMIRISLAVVVSFISLIAIYLTLLSTLNVSSDFADKVYFRLVEEPMMLLEGETHSFKEGSSKLKEGSASWRFNKAFRDFEAFSKLPLSQQLIGFGEKGYFQIGEKEFDPWGMQYQISSHNGLATIIVERGVIGLIFFFILFLLLLKRSVKLFKNNIMLFPFFVLFIFGLVVIIGANTILLDRVGYIIMGGAIGQYLYENYNSNKEEASY